MSVVVKPVHNDFLGHWPYLVPSKGHIWKCSIMKGSLEHSSRLVFMSSSSSAMESDKWSNKQE
jgi:hypothetical protein